MLRLDIGIVVPDREALSIGKRLLELGRKFVEAHDYTSLCRFLIRV